MKRGVMLGLLACCVAGELAAQDDPGSAPLRLSEMLDPQAHVGALIELGAIARLRDDSGRRAALEAFTEHAARLRDRIRATYPAIDDTALDAALAVPGTDFPLLRAVEVARRIVDHGPRPSPNGLLEALASDDVEECRAALVVVEDEPVTALALLPELEARFSELHGDSAVEERASERSGPSYDVLRIGLSRILMGMPVDDRRYELALMHQLDATEPAEGPFDRQPLRALRQLRERPLQSVAVRYRVIRAMCSRRAGLRRAGREALATFEVPPPDARGADRAAWLAEMRRTDDPLRAWVLRDLLAWGHVHTDAEVPTRLRQRLMLASPGDDRDAMEALLDAWDPGWRERDR